MRLLLDLHVPMVAKAKTHYQIVAISKYERFHLFELGTQHPDSQPITCLRVLRVVKGAHEILKNV